MLTTVSAAGDSPKEHFDRGMQAMDAQKYDTACDEFGKSDALAPTMATKFQLGRCNEARGKHATARYHFIECQRLAANTGDVDRAKVARERVVEAEKNAPRLRLQVTAPTEGQTIVVNGVEIERAKWAEPLYLDPGTVALTASAPGRRAFKFEINTSEPGAEIHVPIPELVPADRAGDPEPIPGEGVVRNKGMMVAGITLSALGGVALVAGAIVLPVAKATDFECDFELTECGAGRAGIALMVVGGTSLLAGIPLAVIGGRKAPVEEKPKRYAVTITPWISAIGGGVRGTF
jgi:hypothetical protein